MKRNSRAAWLARCSLLLLAAYLSSGPITARAGDAAPHAAPAVMRRQMINDPFINKDAYSVMVPDQWQAKGQINWVPGQPTPSVYLVVNNPDNTAAYQQLPTLQYKANVQENMDYMFPMQRANNAQKFAEGQTDAAGSLEFRKVPDSTKDYVMNVLIPKSFPGMAQAKDLKAVSDTDMPDVAKAAAEKDPLHRQFKAGQVQVTYTTPKGPMKAQIVTVLCTMPLKQGQGQGPRPDPVVFWTSNTYLYRAPANQFDATVPTLSTIHSSVQVQLPWFNVMQQVAVETITALQQAEMQAIVNQGQSILNNQEIMRKAAQQKSDMVSQEIHDKFADTMATHDAMQTREINYINNTGNYRDPQTGGLVNLSQDFKYHFTNGQGVFVESDDPNPAGFAPNELKSLDRVN